MQPESCAHRQGRLSLAPIAAGATVLPGEGLSATIVHQALIQGFGWVVLYGGIGVWLLAGLSFFIFGRKDAAPSRSKS
ncbi:hypothetical protein ACXIUS_25105 [Bosea thiooxidans]